MSGGTVIGHVECPECGFGEAEVKADRKGHAYRRCAACGSNYFTHGGARDEALRRRMKPAGEAEPEPEAPPAPDDAPPPSPPPKKSFLEELLS